MQYVDKRERREREEGRGGLAGREERRAGICRFDLFD
jgi:hypothetical protein